MEGSDKLLADLRLLLAIKDGSCDGLLSLLLDKAIETALNYTCRTQFIPQLSSIVVDMALIAYNRMGAEGEQGRTEGGISQTFYVLGDDLPKSIQTQLQRYTKARVIG